MHELLCRNMAEIGLKKKRLAVMASSFPLQVRQYDSQDAENEIQAGQNTYGRTGEEVNARDGSYSTNIILQHPGRKPGCFFEYICNVNFVA